MSNALYFLDPQFWLSPSHVILFLTSIFAIVLLRYLLLAFAYDKAVKKLFSRRLENQPAANKQQWKKEITWSAISSLIFTILGAACFWAYQQGYTKVYDKINAYSLSWFFISIVLILFLYETYYYWLHRWMHHPAVFRIVHKVHHDSIHTSVFTSFSFHPIEAVLQFIFLPVIIFIIPVHYYALGIVLMLMTISAIINHAGIEIFPKHFYRHTIGKWLIGSTHHDLHHREFRNNFGLYFTFWDKWMNTESKNYISSFDRNTETRK